MSSLTCITGAVEGKNSIVMKETDTKDKFWEVRLKFSNTVLPANGKAAHRAGTMYEVRRDICRQLNLKYVYYNN
jgi:hypothetical protein